MFFADLLRARRWAGTLGDSTMDQTISASESLNFLAEEGRTQSNSAWCLRPEAEDAEDALSKYLGCRELKTILEAPRVATGGGRGRRKFRAGRWSRGSDGRRSVVVRGVGGWERGS